jgi:hypothetical protein
MLIVPASKVSVPLTVVIRTWVSTSDKDFDPVAEKPLDPPIMSTEEHIHVFDEFSEVMTATA